MTLGAGHTTVEYQKYMSLDGEISLTEYTGFLQDTAHSELVLKSTNENVQWQKKNAYYFEIYVSLFFFAMTTTTWTLWRMYSSTCKNLTVKLILVQVYKKNNLYAYSNT